MGAKRQKLKIFLGDGGGEVVPMEGLFFLVGSGVWSKGCKAHCHYINSCYPLPWKIRDWGESVLFPTLTNNLKKFTVFVT